MVGVAALGWLRLNTTHTDIVVVWQDKTKVIDSDSICIHMDMCDYNYVPSTIDFNSIFRNILQ